MYLIFASAPNDAGPDKLLGGVGCYRREQQGFAG